MKNKNVVLIAALLILLGAFLFFFFNREYDDISFFDGEKRISQSELMEELQNILEKNEEIDSISYRITTKYLWGELVRDFSEKEGKLRIRGRDPETLIIADEKEGVIYFYSIGETEAVMADFEVAKESVDKSAREYAREVLKYQPFVLGSEILEEKDCLVLEYEREYDEIKMWLWKEHGIPVKIEITREDGEKVELLIENINFDDFPDDFFELPMEVQGTRDSFYVY
jgi:outer membrane lipoprotein-sorting protein